MEHRKWAPLLGLVALAVATRLAFLWLAGAYGEIMNGDGASYLQIAANLRSGAGFAWGPGLSTAFRPFGYPWVIAGIYTFFGPAVAAVQLVQLVLRVVTVVLVYVLGWRLAGQQVGVLAGVCAALHPIFLYTSGLIAPEAPAIALEPAVSLLGVRLAVADEVRWLDLRLFVLCAATAVLIRPELILLVLLIPAAAVVSRRVSRRTADVLLAGTAATVVLSVAPPTIRNWRVFGEIVPFPTSGGVTCWGANNAAANGGWLMPTADHWPDKDPPSPGMQGWPGLSEPESQARFYAIAWKWIGRNPVQTAALVPAKLLRSWTMSYADETKPSELSVFLDWLNAGFGALALMGMIMAARARRQPVLVMLPLVPVGAWLIKTIVFFGSARQTASALLFCCIFAAFCVTKAADKVRQRGLAAEMIAQ